MKYHISENIRAAIPEEVRNDKTSSTTAWFLSQLMKNKVNYQPCFGILLQIAEVALTLPDSNVWPERGASAMKLVKTRCRSSLQNDMLESLQMVLINGPSVKDSGPVVKLAVKLWLGGKKRKKLPPVKVHVNKSSSRGWWRNQRFNQRLSFHHLSPHELLLQFMSIQFMRKWLKLACCWI